MPADHQTLIGTLIAAAKREEEIIDALIAAVKAGNKTAILKAAHQIAENRNHSENNTEP